MKYSFINTKGARKQKRNDARGRHFFPSLSPSFSLSLYLFSFLNFLVFNATNESFNIYPINPRYNSKHSKMVTEINRPSIDISTDRYPTAAGNNYRLLAAVESTANRRINLNRFK